MNKIVSATGIAVATNKRQRREGREDIPRVGPEMQQAMENVVMSARQQGITDPAEISQMMHAARARVRREGRKRVADR